MTDDDLIARLRDAQYATARLCPELRDEAADALERLQRELGAAMDTLAHLRQTEERCERAEAELQRLRERQELIDRVGPPNHPDDERHWVGAYLTAMTEVKRLTLLPEEALGFAYAYCCTWVSCGRDLLKMEVPKLLEAWRKANGLREE